MTDNQDTPFLSEADRADAKKHYAKAQEGGGSTPEPGNYRLRLPEKLPADTAFKCKTAKDGRLYLSITLDNSQGTKEAGGEGMTIIAGPHQGRSVRFQRINTLLKPAVRYDREKQTSVPILDDDGSPATYSDAYDLLKKFDPNAELPNTEREWIDAIAQHAGKEIPGTVRLEWEGRCEGNKDGEYPVRLRTKDFKEGKALKPYVEQVAEVQFTQKRKGQDFTVDPGDTYRVYPNLTLGFRAFASR